MRLSKKQKTALEDAFNTWQDEYINDPDAFESSLKTAMRRKGERAVDDKPSYGADCVAMLENYMKREA